MLKKINERTYLNFIVGLAFLISAIGGLILWSNLGRVSDLFAGNIKEVGSDFIVLNGNFVFDSVTDDRSGTVDLKIKISNGTKFTRTEIKIPKTNQIFKIDELSKTETVSSVEGLITDFNSVQGSIGVEVDLKNRFLPWSSFKAKEIRYRLGVRSN